jgi:hypothetical protein
MPLGVLSSTTIVLATIAGRLAETLVKVAPASVETSIRLEALLQAIHILEGLVGSIAMSLMVAGAARVTQVAPSSVVTYKAAPLEA